MLKNKNFGIFIVIILLVGVIAGVMLAIQNNDDKPNENGTYVSSNTIVDSTNGNRFDHIIGKPVIDFEDGAEIFFDESLAAYLHRMEFGVPATDENGNYYTDKDGDIVYDTSEEKNLKWVMDNLITLINHFAKENYSIDANHQIQRFYVNYHNRLSKFSYEELIERLTICFPREGANKSTLGTTVLDIFGISSSDGCAFVFVPMTVAEITVGFYNVAPDDVELTDEEKLLCIYDSWKIAEDDDYERNLEGWLHGFIQSASESGFDDEKIVVAQILYAGSIADAEYRADWKEALVRCLSIENWTYDELKYAVSQEFGVSIDYNVPIQEYFEKLNSEVRR